MTLTMSTTTQIFLHLLCTCSLLLLFGAKCRCDGGGGGQWSLLIKSSGISAMHMQLLRNDRVVIFDRTTFGPSRIQLPKGANCNQDCTAHSIEYDVASNAVRPLTVLTNTWCSSASVSSNGSLIQTGGFADGGAVVRVLNPCPGCDWEEHPGGLAVGRWYATSQVLPDGRKIVVGGINQPNYEFVPKTAPFESVHDFGFLRDTLDGVNSAEENNLYPFVFLNVDGNLFIFANNRSVLLDHVKGVVLRRYPVIPGGDPRNYPCTGSAVLLPLQRKTTSSSSNNQTQPAAAADHYSFDPEVLVCGGAPRGSFGQASRGIFQGSLATCGRIKINDPAPQWAMETMPLPRLMGDMLLLPTGDVLIINGAKSGSAGWENARDPVLNPVIYSPGKEVGDRFQVLNPTQIPRMYHSSAIVLRDGRVLVGGSNPHQFDTFAPDALFPTDMSLEAFSPPYIDPASKLHPTILSPDSHAKVRYGKRFGVRFSVPGGEILGEKVTVTMLAPSLTTHSFAMNQRLLVIGQGAAPAEGSVGVFEVQVIAPESPNLAPAGYYIIFVVHNGIASEGVWVHLK